MKKIAYVIDCMYNSGGMERVLSVCANAICDVYNVTVITAFQKGQPDFFELDSRIKRYDLGINDNANIRQKKRDYKRALSAYLLVEHFDVVISMGGMDLDFLYSICDGSRKMVWFHFVIDSEWQYACENTNLLVRLKAKLQKWKRIYYAKKYDRIIVISKADLQQWTRFANQVSLIYNPITISSAAVSDLSSKNVISVGRLDFQKGFDLLIDAWRYVAVRHPDWHLNIFGEGERRNALQQQIDKSDLSQHITLCGRTPDIAVEYSRHSIFVMSSRAEGFGLVLVEAASCGLPLISFDCPSGPREIVTDGENGYLIPHVGDIDAMAEKICLLIENAELRKQMGEKAKLMVDKFSPLKIKEQWINLFDSICKK